MSAGELRDRIAFDRRALISDGYGNEQGDWEEQFIRWGRLRPRLGGEQVMAARLQGVQPYTIKVWFDNKTRQIGTDWRARNLADGKVYAILGVINPDEKKKMLEFEVRAGEVA